MNNQGYFKGLRKQKVRFNAVDFTILLLIFACIGSIVIRSVFMEDLNKLFNLGNYNVSFSIRNVEYRVYNELKKSSDAVVYDARDNTKLGELSVSLSSNVTNATEFVRLGDNSIYKAKYPKTGGENWAQTDIVDIIDNTMLCKCTMTDGVYYINGSICITPGTVLTVYTESVEVVITITNITPLTTVQ